MASRLCHPFRLQPICSLHLTITLPPVKTGQSFGGISAWAISATPAHGLGLVTHGAMCQSTLMLSAQELSNFRLGLSMNATPISPTQGW